MKYIKQMYDWVLQWAETPYGVPALLVLAFAESSFFPIPPDVLLIALAIAVPKRSFYFALVCTVGSIIGGIVGYGIGSLFYESIGEPIVHLYHGEPVMTKIRLWYDQYGFWGVLIAAITPIPYKIFTIASGVFEFKFSTFFLSSVIGRSIRFFAVGTLIFYFGAPIKIFIEKYFNILSILFVILLVGGFVIIKFLI